MCGDKEIYEWSDIPDPQIEYHIKTFLLDRGYYKPAIKYLDGHFQVTAGPRSRILKIVVSGWPPGARRQFNKRRFLKRGLSPRALDEIEGSALSVLSQEGYPCSEIKTEAFPEKGEVKVLVQPGAFQVFPRPSRDQVSGFDSLTLERYEAFKIGEMYNSMLVELSERRIRESGLVQDVAYLPRCEQSPFALQQRLFPGKPKFLSLGAGFDTEQYLIAQAKYKVERLNSQGSSLSTRLFASYRTQSILNVLELHMWPPSARDRLYFSLDGVRENEKSYENIVASLGGGLGKSWDSKWGFFDVKGGPTLEQIWIYRGLGAKNTKVVGAEGSLLWTSHPFEYFAGNPRTGHKVLIETQGASSELVSSFSVTNLKIFGEKLFLLDENHVADLVLGLRSFLASSLVPRSELGKRQIPSRYRFFLGGSQDLRGFGRQSLPRDGAGAFSALYLGTELRLARFTKLEPLLFLDLGLLGQEKMDFEWPLYFSPGLGFRYPSPIGTLRSSLAYGNSWGGLENRKSRGMQFFLSFGEEF